MTLYLDDILARVPGGDQILSIVIELGNGGFLGLQALTDEVLSNGWNKPCEGEASITLSMQPTLNIPPYFSLVYE